MNTPILSYRGRTVTAADLDAIRALQAAHPELSRRAFSQRLCEHWDWRQPSGALRDMMARSLLLALHRAGHITLPPVRHQPPNNAIARRRPAPVAVDTDPLEGRLGVRPTPGTGGGAPHPPGGALRRVDRRSTTTSAPPMGWANR